MKYPIGLQSFEQIREDVYVDKTAMLYKFVSEGEIYFLNRPRKFGKSLLVSTLENYFLGRKELFQGLAIDELKKEGFRCSTFETDADSILFVASDALSHYIMMMYEVEHRDQFAAEWEEAMARHSKNENYMRTALSLPKHHFETKVLDKVLNSMGSSINFQRH